MAESAAARKELARVEYTEVCTNFRHYSNLRFGILAVCLGTFIFLAVSIMNGNSTTHPILLSFLKIVGLLTTAVFWRYQDITMKHLAYYSARAKELETTLGYKNLSTRPTPERWFSRMDLATQLLYGMLLLFWVSAFFF